MNSDNFFLENETPYYVPETPPSLLRTRRNLYREFHRNFNARTKKFPDWEKVLGSCDLNFVDMPTDRYSGKFILNMVTENSKAQFMVFDYLREDLQHNIKLENKCQSSRAQTDQGYFIFSYRFEGQYSFFVPTDFGNFIKLRFANCRSMDFEVDLTK